MQTAHLHGVELEYYAVGSGEPLLLIHGGFIADSFHSLLAEPRITSRHLAIAYHRRGYAGSSPTAGPVTIAEHAADARALLRHLDIPRAHVTGHSSGGTIALQLALDAPDLVGSLELLEPGLIFLVPSGPAFLERLLSLRETYRYGDREGALDGFLSGIAGPEYRELIRKFLPPRAFDLAVADARTSFEVELEALQRWRFTAEDAGRIRQPLLSVIGEESEPIFGEVRSLLQQWMPHAEELVVPQANHALQFMNPKAVADGLARFLEQHPL